MHVLEVLVDALKMVKEHPELVKQLEIKTRECETFRQKVTRLEKQLAKIKKEMENPED
jgi:hypothetical protein